MVTLQLDKDKSEEMDLSKFPLAPDRTSAPGREAEEEEEEEEDDDEDISKYDLLADSGDEATETRYMCVCVPQ